MAAMKSFRYFSLALLLSLFVSSPALSANNIYLGFSLGDAHDDILDENSGAFKLYGGYQFLPNAAIEFAIVDLGEYGAFPPFQQSGLAMEFVPRITVSPNVDLFAKLGLFAWDISVFDTRVDSGTDLTYGVGVDFFIANNTSLRAEWEEFTDISGGDVSLLSAGISFWF